MTLREIYFPWYLCPLGGAPTKPRQTWTLRCHSVLMKSFGSYIKNSYRTLLPDNGRKRVYLKEIRIPRYP